MSLRYFHNVHIKQEKVVHIKFTSTESHLNFKVQLFLSSAQVPTELEASLNLPYFSTNTHD